MKERIKILVVDDHDSIRGVLSAMLDDKGYKVEAARTGREAMEKFRAESFDAALIDIRLPDIEGTELLKVLNKLHPDAVKIMITGYPSLHNAVQCMNSGADGYLVKPFKFGELLEQIEKQLEKHQRARWEKVLRSTGLSASEAKVYLSLAVEGCSEVGRLSTSSGVPRSMSCAALRKLIERGLAFEVPGMPGKFAVKTPSSALGAFVRSLKKQFSEQTAATSRMRV
jgi:CheY-like chemotaxis protein